MYKIVGKALIEYLDDDEPNGTISVTQLREFTDLFIGDDTIGLVRNNKIQTIRDTEMIPDRKTFEEALIPEIAGKTATEIYLNETELSNASSRHSSFANSFSKRNTRRSLKKRKSTRKHQ